MGTPDMRLPIQYALTYPDRRPSPAAAPDLIGIRRLEFRAPDETRFPALRIAREAGRMGPRASAALIVADEIAVARFLARTLEFPGIPRLLETAVSRFGAGTTEPDLDELVALDREIREAYSTGPLGGRA
jgi:1-deoxy-D-xylulose-5-phosphate reductoisomerase